VAPEGSVSGRVFETVIRVCTVYYYRVIERVKKNVRRRRKNIETRKNIFGAKGLRCGLLFERNGRLPHFARGQRIAAVVSYSLSFDVKTEQNDR
jgi:hypothetical protein